MITCGDSLSDEESDSPFGSEAQEYVDSDKADSDIEIELYSQIHYAKDFDESASAASIQNDSNCVQVTPITRIGSFSDMKSKEGSVPKVKRNTLGLVRFNHFESSTPKNLLKNDLTIGKETTETSFDAQVKLLKAKIKKRKTAASVSNHKWSRDSGCVESDMVRSDSESDESVICLDNDEYCDSSSIMMNIKEHVQIGDVILLDSTTTSEEESSGQNSDSPDLSDSEGSLKVTPNATASVTNHRADLWQIDNEDRFSFIKKQNRYHEKRSSFCNNCKKKGHLSKDCMEPRNMRCYICGRDHVWTMCYQRICGKCFEYGHCSRNCRYRSSEIMCSLCRMRGHHLVNCPDIWRRYHLTTSSDIIVKGAKEQVEGVKKYCYNCGFEGHYGHECLKPRMSPDSFPTWPFIISYKDPSRYFKKNLKKDAKGQSSDPGKHYGPRSKQRHNKKHRSHGDGLHTVISGFSGKQHEKSKKSRNKERAKNQFREDKCGPFLKGNDFPRSLSAINLEKDGHKKRKKRDMDRLFHFKRKKQKLNATF